MFFWLTFWPICVTLMPVPTRGFLLFMKQKEIVKILQKHGLEIIASILVVVIGFAVVFPKATLADDLDHPTPAEQLAIDLMVEEIQNSSVPYGSLPESADRLAPQTMTITATAYTSEVRQTDSTPFITASGTTVRHGVIAANFLPIGTKVKIPDYYGEQIFVVEDRMNQRYWHRVDIWMEDIGEARQFGVRNIDIEIYQ